MIVRQEKTYASGALTLDSMAVGGVNGDGKLDLVVVHEAGLVGVLLGNGDGTFQPVQTYSSGGSLSYSIAIADVHGDGKPDLLVTDQVVNSSGAASAVGVLLGYGNGTFQAVKTYSTGVPLAESIGVADVNGDGKADLLVAHKCGGSGFCNSSPVVALLGNGDGTFKSALKYGSGGGMHFRSRWQT